MIAWQQDDENLQGWLQATQPEEGNGKWIMKEGLLYGREGEKELLVVPNKLKATVLKLAHDIPSAGHLAVGKSLNQIRQRFMWPQMRKEVEAYCQMCKECQKTQPNQLQGPFWFHCR